VPSRRCSPHAPGGSCAPAAAPSTSPRTRSRPWAAPPSAPAGGIAASRPRPAPSADWTSPRPSTCCSGWGPPPSATWRPCPPPRPGRRLAPPEPARLLQRRGLPTPGALAALPTAAVTARFGPDVAPRRLPAQGQEPAPPATHPPAQPILAETVLDTPLVRTDQAAFIARPLAEQLHEMLLDRGLVCTRLRIVARTEGGEEMERTWRHDGALSVADVVDRIRWQCDGWITRSRLGGPATGAITRIGLHPLQLAPAGEGAPALWGSAGEAAQRASRAFARAQGLAGEDAIQVPAAVGGRLLSEEMQLVPWRAERPARREGPWPGSLPRPVPATVFR